jgi:hypothetical protein
MEFPFSYFPASSLLETSFLISKHPLYLEVPFCYLLASLFHEISYSYLPDSPLNVIPRFFFQLSALGTNPIQM